MNVEATPPTVEVEDIYPLSPMQQGMLFHTLYSPEAGQYFEQTCWELRGAVDGPALVRAWAHALDRHPALRTAFVWEGVDEPVQVVQRGVTLPVATLDWRATPPAELDGRLEAFLQADRARGFDLTQAPLMRLALIHVDDGAAFLVWSHHHLLLDGWSGPLLMQEVLAAYEALRRGLPIRLPPARPYRDYIAWLAEQDAGAAEAYWRRTLRGFTAPTPLVVDRAGAPADQAAVSAIEASRLPAEVTARLQALARQHGLTLATCVQAAWALLLHRYSGEDDVVFGATVSGRPADLPGAEGMIGLFINTLPVRVQLGADETALALLKRLQTAQAEQRQYEFTSLIQIQGWSDVPRGTPLFESLLVYESYPVDPALAERGDGLGLRQRASFARTNYPLTFVVSPGRELGLQVAYDAGRFEPDAIRRMLGHVQTLLAGLAAGLERPVQELPLLSEAEQRQILVDWNRTEVEATLACIHQRFEAQVRRTPDAPALILAGQTITYADLDRRADQLARRLQELGVRPEAIVGVCVEPSFDMIAAVLAVLKAGGAFLPLDPDYPAERLAFMLQDAGVRLLLTTATLAPRLPHAAARVICLDTDWAPLTPSAISPPPSAPGPQPPTPDSLAYVIYTSGSTGTPKGVLLRHGGLTNFCHAFQHFMDVRPDDRVLQFASFSFDAAVAEIFIALLSGAALVLAPRETRMSMPDLARLIQAEAVTLIILPPTVLSLLPADELRSVRTVTSAGEACRPEIVARWAPGRRFFNGYGPTEITVGAAFKRLEPGDPVTLGRPIANTRAYVLDRRLRPVPIGVPGELCLSSPGVARGYLNRPELTAEKFIPSPFPLAGERAGEEGRLYRTGDLVRWLPSGELEYLGRLDHQVKLRGYRIELGEIEAALRQHPAVAEAVVVAREARPGDQRLAAYVVLADDRRRTTDDGEPTNAVARPPAAVLSELRDFLRQRLPDYMLPATFTPLDRLPLTPNGKVDRKALPAPDGSPAAAEAYVAPRTPTEEIIAGQWAAVLGRPRVGVHDNFFELGGHSLLATQVVSRAREAFQVDVPLRRLFEAPTVAGLAASVDAARRSANGQAAPPLTTVARDGELPLSFAQQRLWFLDQLEPNRPDYNIPTALRLRGPLDVAALARALDEIIRRHEALRTTFADEDGRPVQVIASARSYALPVVDLSGRPDREAEALRLASVEARAPFDLARGPLLRAQLLCLAPDDHIALLTTHHIISDGWSMGLLVSELAALYQAFAAGRPSPLADLPVQYADFAAWQRRWLQGDALEAQMAYWRGQLAGAPPRLELPTDRPRPAVQSSRGATHPFRLSPALREPFKRLLQQEGATLFMGLLAVFQVLLYRYSGQDDFTIGTPIANRTRPELEGLIGFFANTLVLRARLDDAPTLGFRDLLARVREAALGAYAHQDLPFEKLVEVLQPERDLSHSPLFQVMLVLDNAPLGPLQLPGLTLSPVPVETGAASFDLTLAVREAADGWGGYIEYSTDLFDAATIERLVGHLETLIAGLLADPDRPVAELPLLTEAEQAQMLLDWNATSAPFASDRCFHQLFEAWAERQPDATALILDGQTLTYRELDQRADQLAAHLRALGVGPETLVGLCLERSFEMIIGLLGSLKAGGAFLPLDPHYPAERLAFMLQDSGARLVLTTAALAPRLPHSAAQVICLDTDWDSGTPASVADLQSQVTPDSLAYVIYTSGSTGQPKGTLLRHRGLCNLAEAQRIQFDIQPGVSRVLQFSPFSFDASVWEVAMALGNGAALVLARQEAITGDLIGVLRAARVNVVTLPPSVLSVLDPAGLPDLRVVVSAGEACSREIVARWAPGRRFVNAYGPTETTVCASWTVCHPADLRPPSIGRPIANVQLYLLDRNLQPVPVGVPGELVIGGVGVARGYLNRPELTAEKFIPSPFPLPGGSAGDPGRLYRTGDLCRFRPDGEVEFLGRLDQQVKVRGFRIELGEIEAALRALPGVQDAVALARDDRPGDKRLVAYLILAEDSRRTTDDSEPASAARLPSAVLDELRDRLRARLPDYMVPSAFVRLEAFPLSPSGKVDRRALPAPDLADSVRAAYVAPRTETERRLAAICADLLGLERVGVDDSFFELGGHSLLATQLVSRVRAQFQVELPLRSLFEHPTVAGLAEVIDQSPRTDPDRQPPAITARPREGRRVRRADLDGRNTSP